MSARDSYSALPAAQAKRLRRQHRWIGVVALLVLAIVIVVIRGTEVEQATEASTQAGAKALRAAIEGDRAQFAVAEQHFREGVRGMVFDAYPMFCLELTRAVAAGEPPTVRADLAPATQALTSGDLAGAQRALREVKDGIGKRWLTRLVQEMSD